MENVFFSYACSQWKLDEHNEINFSDCWIKYKKIKNMIIEQDAQHLITQIVYGEK